MMCLNTESVILWPINHWSVSTDKPVVLPLLLKKLCGGEGKNRPFRQMEMKHTAELFTSSIRLTAVWERRDQVVKIFAWKRFMFGFYKKILHDRLHHAQFNSTWMVLTLLIPCSLHTHDFSFVPTWQKSEAVVCFCKQDLSVFHHPPIIICSHHLHRPTADMVTQILPPEYRRGKPGPVFEAETAARQDKPCAESKVKASCQHWAGERINLPYGDNQISLVWQYKAKGSTCEAGCTWENQEQRGLETQQSSHTAPSQILAGDQNSE